MSADEYPGAEQEAQRLIDQFDLLMLNGPLRQRGIDRIDPDGDDDITGDDVLTSTVGGQADDRRVCVDADMAGEGEEQNDGDGDDYDRRLRDEDDRGVDFGFPFDPQYVEFGNRQTLFDRSDRHRQRYNTDSGQGRTDGIERDGQRNPDGDDDGECPFPQRHNVDAAKDDALGGAGAPRDGRPIVVRDPLRARDASAPRVLDVARGIVDDGQMVLVMDQHRLAPNSASAYTNLNGAAYTTADLVNYLYAEEPASKSVPHTQQSLTQAQVNGLLALIADGHAHVVAPLDTDHATYALSCPLDSSSAVPPDVTAAVDAHLECALVDDEQAVDLVDYHVAAFEHYAVEIAMAIGWDYKPAVNFAIARYINIAARPLLAEEGGLLPDEIPRRRHPHRLGEQYRDQPHEDMHDAVSDSGYDDDDVACDDDDHMDDDAVVGLLCHSHALDDPNQDMEQNGGDTRGPDACPMDSVLVAAETRDEAVARHRALAEHRRRHPPMGMDLELVAALLHAEAEDGLAAVSANMDEMRRRLQIAVGSRLKASKAARKIDRYVVPWAYGICCALDRRDVDEVLASQDNAEAVRRRAACAWTAEASRPGGAQGSNALARAGSKPPRPLAPYLSDAEYVQRLSRLDPSLLAALSRVIPLEARGRSDLDAGDYVIYESNLAVGAPLSPPIRHSLAQKVMRFRRQGGTIARACDIASKPPPIVFVRDCPSAAAGVASAAAVV